MTNEEVLDLFKQLMNNPIFVNNLKLLVESPLEKREYQTIYEALHRMENMYYYCLKEDERPPQPKILNRQASLKRLLRSPKSFSRFGDGELALIKGIPIAFQNYNEKLSKKLRNILSEKSTEETCYIGLCYSYYHSSLKFAKRSKMWSLIQTPACRDIIAEYFDPEYEYIDASFTALYNSTEDDTLLKDFYNSWKTLFSQYDLYVVIGEGIYKKIQKHNIFESAKSVEYLVAPSINAFDEYDTILNEIFSQPKNRVIVSVLGPTATVLSYELSKFSYIAWDIGYLPKDYLFYMEKRPRMDEGTEDFWSPDV